jgi:hypothetical protein
MRRLTALITVAAFFPAFANTSSGASRDLPARFPIKQPGKWGFIDQTVKVVIPPQFDRVAIFPQAWPRWKSAGNGALWTPTGKWPSLPGSPPRAIFTKALGLAIAKNVIEAHGGEIGGGGRTGKHFLVYFTQA